MINLPILTIAALINGLNPCGVGMMVTFLGYLLLFGGTRKKGEIVKIGIAYLLGMFVTYLLSGLVFYGLAYYMQRWWIASVFRYVIGIAILIAGVLQIKDFFFPDSPVHLRMGLKQFKVISGLMEKASLPMALLIGFLTTAFSTPCMMPLYVGTTAVIARSGLPVLLMLLYFVYYNLIFILPLMVILVLMVAGKGVVEMKELNHKVEKWMRLVMGMVMVGVGWWLMK